jgi:hypothetical protein
MEWIVLGCLLLLLLILLLFSVSFSSSLFIFLSFFLLAVYTCLTLSCAKAYDPSAANPRPHDGAAACLTHLLIASFLTDYGAESQSQSVRICADRSSDEHEASFCLNATSATTKQHRSNSAATINPAIATSTTPIARALSDACTCFAAYSAA